jgi:hypothetical protein
LICGCVLNGSIAACADWAAVDARFHGVVLQSKVATTLTLTQRLFFVLQTLGNRAFLERSQRPTRDVITQGTHVTQHHFA